MSLYANGAPAAPVHTEFAFAAAWLMKHRCPPFAFGDTCAIAVDSWCSVRRGPDAGVAAAAAQSSSKSSGGGIASVRRRLGRPGARQCVSAAHADTPLTSRGSGGARGQTQRDARAALRWAVPTLWRRRGAARYRRAPRGAAAGRAIREHDARSVRLRAPQPAGAAAPAAVAKGWTRLTRRAQLAPALAPQSDGAAARAGAHRCDDTPEGARRRGAPACARGRRRKARHKMRRRPHEPRKGPNAAAGAPDQKPVK